LSFSSQIIDHRRGNCTAKVHCTHCNVGEGHNTKVCFKKFPHLKKIFDKATNSTASSPGRSALPPLQTILQDRSRQLQPPRAQQHPRRTGASAYVAQQQQQYQTVTNTSNQPIPAAPSPNYCHYHNVWSHGDTNCSLQQHQQQVHRTATVPSTPIRAQSAPSNKPRVPLAQVECYNCHQKGHYRSQCTMNTQTVGCTNLDKSLSHKPTICTHVSNWRNYHCDPEQEWSELEFIVDTGSDINLVNSALIYAMGLEDSIQLPSNPVSQLNGQELEIIGRILLPISLGTPPLVNTQQWFDVNNYGLNILGTPFLKDTSSVPDIANKQLFVNNYQHSIPLNIEPWSKNDLVFDDDQITSVNPQQASVNLIVIPKINPPKAPVSEPVMFYPVSNGTNHESAEDKATRLASRDSVPVAQQPVSPTTSPFTNRALCIMDEKLPPNIPPAFADVPQIPHVNLLTSKHSTIQKANEDQQQQLNRIRADAAVFYPKGLALLEKQGEDGYNFSTLPGKSTATNVRLHPVEAEGNTERLGIGCTPQNASTQKAAKINIARVNRSLEFTETVTETGSPAPRVCTVKQPLIAFAKPEQTPEIQLSQLTIVDAQVNNPSTTSDNELTAPQLSVMANLNGPPTDDKKRFLKNVPQQYKARLNQIITDYQAAIKIDEPSTLPPVKIKVKPDAVPVVERKRRHSLVNEDVIKKEIDKLYQKGVIRRSNSAWSSELVVAPKPHSNQKRVCVDYQKLNSVTEPNLYGLRNIDHLITRFNDFKVASKIDLSSAFQQVRLTPESIQYTAFRTGEGNWEYVTMPYGLINAPADFHPSRLPNSNGRHLS